MSDVARCGAAEQRARALGDSAIAEAASARQVFTPVISVSLVAASSTAMSLSRRRRAGERGTAARGTCAEARKGHRGEERELARHGMAWESAQVGAGFVSFSCPLP